MEGTRKEIGLDKEIDQEEIYSLAKRRILNLENYNHNLANQMISLLNSINGNILSLTSFLKDRGFLGEEDGKDRGKARSKDEMAMDITYTSMDQEVHKTHQ